MFSFNENVNAPFQGSGLWRAHSHSQIPQGQGTCQDIVLTYFKQGSQGSFGRPCNAQKFCALVSFDRFRAQYDTIHHATVGDLNFESIQYD